MSKYGSAREKNSILNKKSKNRLINTANSPYLRGKASVLTGLTKNNLKDKQNTYFAPSPVNFRMEFTKSLLILPSALNGIRLKYRDQPIFLLFCLSTRLTDN